MPEELKSEILREIGAIARCAQTLNDHAFRKSGLQRGQFVFITRICENRGVSLVNLSRILQVDKTTTTKAVQKLIEQGFVEKRADQNDKRMWNLYPTDQALALYPDILAKENTSIEVCCRGLDEGERETALRLLGIMRRNFTEICAEIWPEGAGTVRVCEYRARYHDELVQMIGNIQREEFHIPITIDGQPDLQNIESFYQEQGNFWVALCEGHVVGSIGVRRLDGTNAALRKMFVDARYRGKEKGVSAKLLRQLLRWARQQGIGIVYLGTTSRFLAAHRFYEKNGFQQIGKEDLPADFPVMDVDNTFYRYELQ